MLLAKRGAVSLKLLFELEPGLQGRRRVRRIRVFAQSCAAAVGDSRRHQAAVGVRRVLVVVKVAEMAVVVVELVHVAVDMVRMIVVVMVMMVVSEMIGVCVAGEMAAVVHVVELLIAVLALEVEKIGRAAVVQRVEVFERLQVNIGAGRVGRVVGGRGYGGRGIAANVRVARVAGLLVVSVESV